MEFDPKKAAANFRKHGVLFGDAESAVRDPLGVTVEDQDAEGERRFITVGMGQTGDLLVVVFSESDGVYRLISARKATRKERTSYEG
jgi:uncharacterized DUF497 family protein